MNKVQIEVQSLVSKPPNSNMLALKHKLWVHLIYNRYNLSFCSALYFLQIASATSEKAH